LSANHLVTNPSSTVLIVQEGEDKTEEQKKGSKKKAGKNTKMDHLHVLTGLCCILIRDSSHLA